MADVPYTNEIEEWRDVPDWPTYQVSSYGRLRSIHRGRCRLRKLHANYSGYLTAELSDMPRKQKMRVHRLVCEAFHGPAPEGRPEVAHADGTRDNNHYSNLRWASRKENAADQIAHGTFVFPPRHLGTGKLSARDLVDIAALKAAGHATADIAAIYAVDRRTVNRIYRTGRP